MLARTWLMRPSLVAGVPGMPSSGCHVGGSRARGDMSHVEATGTGPPKRSRRVWTVHTTHKPDDQLTPVTHTGTTNIGQSVIMKGEFTRSEDLVVDGLVERTNAFRKHLLTVGPSARIQATMSTGL